MKVTKQEIENLKKLLKVLQKAEADMTRMTEQEKKDNAVKMGDIYY